MASKNRPRELISDIVDQARVYAMEDYPPEKGYVVSQHKNEIWVDDKFGKEVLTIVIVRGEDL
jgi:hypothetical protein